MVNGVTNGIPIGRMGDFLTWYIKAKYVSYKYKIPFILNTPEAHLDDVKKLALFHNEPLHLKDHLYCINSITVAACEQDIHRAKSKPFIALEHQFKADCWTTIDGELEDVTGWGDIMGDTKFRNVLREMIHLTTPLDARFLPPGDMISIAVHVRTGSAWDTDGNRNNWYYKFPTLEFYITALKRLEQMLAPHVLHATIFTDDPEPIKIVRLIMQQVGSTRIRFRYRSAGNTPTRNVLEDLQAMQQYDCLIRGLSSFAQVAHLLGDYKLVIYPLAFDRRTVTKMGIKKKEDYMKLLAQKYNL